MNKKGLIIAMTCCGMIFAGCGNSNNKKSSEADNIATAMTGNDRDEHGCIASAGYTWSEVQKDCIRLWEKGVRMQHVQHSDESMFLVFGPDSAQVELFSSKEGTPNEILNRRTLPSGEHVWNVEDDDTKNVRLENGVWTISQRNKLVYRQASKEDKK